MTLAHLPAGVAVVLAVEGLLYAVAPAAMRRAISSLATLSDGRLRAGGLVVAALATGVAWLLAGR